MEKETSTEMKNFGFLVSSLQDWFENIFVKAASSFYEDKEEAQDSLIISPITILPGGVLHIMMEGAERFRLQSFLQLNIEENGSATNFFPAPRIIWEFGPSPNLTGKKTLIGMSDWKDLPHNSYVWENINLSKEKQFALYACKEDIYRYLAIYLSPSLYDDFEEQILSCWANLLSKMQSTNFMKEECRKLFSNSIRKI